MPRRSQLLRDLRPAAWFPRCQVCSAAPPPGAGLDPHPPHRTQSIMQSALVLPHEAIWPMRENRRGGPAPVSSPAPPPQPVPTGMLRVSLLPKLAGVARIAAPAALHCVEGPFKLCSPPERQSPQTASDAVFSPSRVRVRPAGGVRFPLCNLVQCLRVCNIHLYPKLPFCFLQAEVKASTFCTNCSRGHARDPTAHWGAQPSDSPVGSGEGGWPLTAVCLIARTALPILVKKSPFLAMILDDIDVLAAFIRQSLPSSCVLAIRFPLISPHCFLASWLIATVTDVG